MYVCLFIFQLYQYKIGNITACKKLEKFGDKFEANEKSPHVKQKKFCS